MTLVANTKAWFGKHLATKSDYALVAQNRERQTLIASTGLGVAAGAAVGLGAGAVATALNQKTEFVAQNDIYDPTLVGYEHDYQSVVTSWDTDGVADDWDYEHTYSPEYSNRVVGTFESPSFRDSVGLTPMRGAVLGAAGGGLIGLGVGVALNVMNRASGTEHNRGKVGVELESLKSMIDNDTSNVLKGAAIGASVGTGIGWVAGQVEGAKGAPVTRTFIGPVTQRTHMGEIPADVTTTHRVNKFEATNTRPIHAQVPVYDEHGEPLLEKKTESINGARFSPMKSALVGGAIGLGAGIAGGVAYNLLQRVAAYETMHQPH